MGRDPRESAAELRAIAPLIVTGPQLQLVGPCTLVTNGSQTIAFSSAELLRHAGEPLAIALTLDCTKTLPVTSWSMGRIANMGIIELGAPFPYADPKLDVKPLFLSSVCATLDTRGAPSALVSVQPAPNGRGVMRRLVPVHVDAIDGGMSDVITRLATPDRSDDGDADIDGASLFSWMPADPVLGRRSEILVVALAVPYRQKTFKPRTLPAIAELFGLDDLGRALPWQGEEKKEDSNELGQVAGEIRDEPSASVDIDVEDD
ncbi:MAG TPA: hypothetical protein VLB44_00410 [Kofleriaceae bacterium]|nr:hypothetical protein [Kofleriaceae bacterium]